MDLDSFYRLGLWIQYFRDAEASSPLVKGEGRLIDGLEQVNRILKNNLIGKDCVEETSQWKEKLDSKYDEESKIDEDDSKMIAKDANKWNEKMHRDLKRKHAVEVELLSGLNPDELSKLANKEPGEFISVEVWKKLTDIERSDLSDAAKCLLLGTATPSVMVALRGAEASIRNYYYHKTKEEPGEKTWRQLTRELKSKATASSVENTFIGYLDWFGDAKRNFAQHPNKIYSLRESVIIFMQVVGLIEDIYAQI